MFLLITSVLHRWSLLLAALCMGQVLQAQAFVHTTPDEYLAQRTYDPTLSLKVCRSLPIERMIRQIRLARARI